MKTEIQQISLNHSLQYDLSWLACPHICFALDPSSCMNSCMQGKKTSLPKASFLVYLRICAIRDTVPFFLVQFCGAYRKVHPLRGVSQSIFDNSPEILFLFSGFHEGGWQTDWTFSVFAFPFVVCHIFIEKQFLTINNPVLH